MSMNPGATTSFFASMTRLPRSGALEIAAIRPPVIPTLRTASSHDAGSMTLLFAMTRSYDVCAWATAAAETMRIIEAIRRIELSGGRNYLERDAEIIERHGRDDQWTRDRQEAARGQARPACGLAQGSPFPLPVRFPSYERPTLRALITTALY